MIWRTLKRRLRGGFGPRSLLLDVIYLGICVCGFFFVSSQFSGLKSDAKAIGMPGDPGPAQPLMEMVDDASKRVDQRLDHQGREGGAGLRHIERLPVLKPPLPQVKQQEQQQLQNIDAVVMVEPIQNHGFQRRGGDDPVKKKPTIAAASRMINGQRYPHLAPSGSFVPMRRIVHLDLKGAPYKPSVFPELFALLNRMRATGVLLEWEDMFPYEGRLASAVNGNAYTMKEVEAILASAKLNNLEVFPLVQTFGHLEWILKLDEFAHLRDDAKLPQVICIGKEEAWTLIKDMLKQVGDVHAKHGALPFYHIGADEVFNMGVCNETVELLAKHGNLKERLTLFHIARTAEFVKTTYKTVPLAWHDMFAQAMETDLQHYRLPELLEPVIWSYAEDLDQYLAPSTWQSLQVRNHESWTRQFNRNYLDFEYIQGIIMTGWSRYDHLALLAETMPVGFPSLAMSMETIIEGKEMNGRFPYTSDLLGCILPVQPGYVYGCRFPGRKVYELVNEFVNQKQNLKKYAEEDYEFNGWLSNHAEKYAVSSPMYINKILPFVEYHQLPLERVYTDLKKELSTIFFDDCVEEFLETYIEEDVMFLRRKAAAATKILQRRSFQKRPYVDKKTEL